MGLFNDGGREGETGRIFVQKDGRQAFSALRKEVGAFGVPSEENMVTRVTPHEGKWI